MKKKERAMNTSIPNILVAGVKDKAQALEKLAVRLFVTDTGREAIQCLRNRKVDTVISKWDLIDISQGQFLKKVIAAKPNMPTVALVKQTEDHKQEIAARSIGVSAVLPEDIDDKDFRSIVCQLANVLETAVADKIDYEIEGIRYVLVDV
jgi:DNA-binding NarL/FixJ family response regulator